MGDKMHMTFGGVLLIWLLSLGGFGFLWYKYQHRNGTLVAIDAQAGPPPF